MAIFGFDIESAKGWEDGRQWRDVAPIGVSCAALSTEDKRAGMLWYSAPTKSAISEEMCRGLLVTLHRNVQNHEFVIWNGLGFDLPVLAWECDEWELARSIAPHIYDPCYAMWKLHGFPVGLEKVCIGFGLEGKSKGMDGLHAIELWNHPLERPRVLEYVVQDSVAAAAVGRVIKALGRITWETSSLGISTRNMPWRPAQWYFDRPQPDTSWMTRGEPIKEENFLWWLT